MVDWNGLFQWSINQQQYDDDIKLSTSNFQQMKPEDKKWLEEAMKQYTFNDVDRLGEIVKEIKDHKSIQKEKLLELLDELQELVELHPRNNLNLCLSGGMETMLNIIYENENEGARRMACSIFSSAVQNNTEVQNFVKRYKCLNLMHQLVKEENMKNKESLIGAISSYIRADNYEAKREFFQDYNGLQFLVCIICDSNSSIRLLKKVFFLLYDLVINDDHIFKEQDPTFVRRSLAQDSTVVNKMLVYLTSDLNNNQNLDLREYVIRILKYLVNLKHDLLNVIKPNLDQHFKQLLEALKNTSGDQHQTLKKEFELIKEVYNAPFMKIKSNFDGGNIKDVKEINNGQQSAKVLQIGK